MEVLSCSSTDSANCIFCKKRTGNYKVYRKYGMKLYIPLCNDTCYKKFSLNKEFDFFSKEIKNKTKGGN